jgi:hypothetical protein
MKIFLIILIARVECFNFHSNKCQFMGYFWVIEAEVEQQPLIK